MAMILVEPTKETAKNVNQDQAVKSEQTKKEKEISPEKKAEDEKKAKEEEAEKKANELAEKEAKEKAEKEAKAIEEAAVKAAAEAEIARKAEALKMIGNGDTATNLFEVDSGFIVFDSNYNGGGNFIVQLLDESGNKVELLVNTIGSYKGKSLALIPKGGKYMLNVQAEGAWTIQGSQASPAQSENTAQPLTGSGDDVRFVKIDSGLKKFIFDYKGASNFIVQAKGSVLLANEIGPYQGSKAQQVKDNATYIISVQAEGAWSIKID
jgi:hypothetical protein